MNPHEQAAHAARWLAAGLDPDTQAAAVASWFLDYLCPAKDHAFVCALGSRAWWVASEEVRVLVCVAVGVDE